MSLKSTLTSTILLLICAQVVEASPIDFYNKRSVLVFQ
jgi:hypothetical protein